MDPNTIRIVNTVAADLERGNIEHIVRVFSGISTVPKNAKLLRGKVVLGFPSYEADPRPNWQIPVIRRFIQTLDRQLPHFPYFLLPDLPVAHIGTYLLSLTDGAEDGGIKPVALQAVLKRVETDVRAFCHRIAEPPDGAVQNLYINLPSAFLKRIPELAALALRSMIPLLQALAKQPAGAEPHEKTVINLASELADLDRTRYATREALLAALLERAGGART